MLVDADDATGADVVDFLTVFEYVRHTHDVNGSVDSFVAGLGTATTIAFVVYPLR